MKGNTQVHNTNQASGDFVILPLSDSLQRHPINPNAFTHFCDSAATYVPKQRAAPKFCWQQVSDKTGRGFKPDASQQSGTVANQSTREQLPRPTMATITTQKSHNLDHNNRFFEDNLNVVEATCNIKTQKENKNQQTGRSD